MHRLETIHDLAGIFPPKFSCHRASGADEGYGYALIVPVDTSARIIVTRRAGLVDTTVDRNGNWPCPELAPSRT